MKARARIVANGETPAAPWRHWGLALFLASSGSWLVLIGTAKLVAGLW
jgi:hypothetical protein